MHPLIEKLLKNGPVVTDGSWGTQLQNRGLKRGECPDSWNLSHPEGVEEVARQYVEAGSQIVLTNTFGGSRLSLGRFKLGDKAVAINTAGVEISKKAAGNRAAVFASIGPTGKMLLTKETTEEELQNAFEEQANAQAQAGADGIIVETMIDITEAGIAARAAKRTGLPEIIDEKTIFYTTADEFVKFVPDLIDAGADFIGGCCGSDQSFVSAIRKIIAEW